MTEEARQMDAVEIHPETERLLKRIALAYQQSEFLEDILTDLGGEGAANSLLDFAHSRRFRELMMPVWVVFMLGILYAAAEQAGEDEDASDEETTE